MHRSAREANSRGPSPQFYGRLQPADDFDSDIARPRKSNQSVSDVCKFQIGRPVCLLLVFGLPGGRHAFGAVLYLLGNRIYDGEA
jgi:hypothetical protein